jgi:hypothetical protein
MVLQYTPIIYTHSVFLHYTLNIQSNLKLSAQYEISVVTEGLLQRYESWRMLKPMYYNIIDNIFQRYKFVFHSHSVYQQYNSHTTLKSEIDGFDNTCHNS